MLLYSVNLALMMQESAVFVGTPRENILRKGFATDTDSCDDIREVPDSLRDINNFFDPVDKFYQKYTEAYGIPILGKSMFSTYSKWFTLKSKYAWFCSGLYSPIFLSYS